MSIEVVVIKLRLMKNEIVLVVVQMNKKKSMLMNKEKSRRLEMKC